MGSEARRLPQTLGRLRISAPGTYGRSARTRDAPGTRNVRPPDPRHLAVVEPRRLRHEPRAPVRPSPRLLLERQAHHLRLRPGRDARSRTAGAGPVLEPREALGLIPVQPALDGGKRDSHLPTQSLAERPSAEPRTTRARSTCRCGVVRARTRRSSSLRSPDRNRILRIVGMRERIARHEHHVHPPQATLH